MKKIVIPYLFVAVVLVGMFVGGAVLGFGPRMSFGEKIMRWKGAKQVNETMLNRKAEILGITVEELKQELESGETFLEILEKHDLNLEDWCQKMREQAEEHLDELLEQGEITQEQFEKKLEWLEKHQEKCEQGYGFGTTRMIRKTCWCK